MKKRWQALGILILALSLVGAISAGARPEPGHGSGHCPHKHKVRHDQGGFPHQVLEILDLTAEQHAQIDDITDEHHEVFKTLRKEHRTIMKEIMDKMLAPGDVTMDSFNGQRQLLADLQTRMFNERIAVALQMRQVLTSEQLEQTAKLIAEKRAHWKEHKRKMSEEKGEE